MTKPKNWPEKKRQRQLGALGRLEKALPETINDTDSKRIQREIEHLNAIVPKYSLETVRTKKYRGNK